MPCHQQFNHHLRVPNTFGVTRFFRISASSFKAGWVDLQKHATHLKPITCLNGSMIVIDHPPNKCQKKCKECNEETVYHWLSLSHDIELHEPISLFSTWPVRGMYSHQPVVAGNVGRDTTSPGHRCIWQSYVMDRYHAWGEGHVAVNCHLGVVFCCWCWWWWWCSLPHKTHLYKNLDLDLWHILDAQIVAHLIAHTFWSTSHTTKKNESWHKQGSIWSTHIIHKHT